MFAIIKSAEQTRRAVRAEPRKRAALQDAARPKIQSLGRAARLLELIALRHETGVTLTELASLSGLNKTTAFHLLDSLETLQFVERMPQSLPDSALIVDSIEGSYSLRATSYVGTRCAYHATACGKAIFAHWPSARRRALYDAGPLVGFTASSVVDPTILEAQLERMTPSVLERLDSALVREVAEISHRLGYRPSGA